MHPKVGRGELVSSFQSFRVVASLTWHGATGPGEWQSSSRYVWHQRQEDVGPGCCDSDMTILNSPCLATSQEILTKRKPENVGQAYKLQGQATQS